MKALPYIATVMLLCTSLPGAAETKAAGGTQMTTTRSKDGTPIAYKRSGKGPALLLVHGTGGNHTRWAPVLPQLEARFTVYAMDRRGRGRSGDAAAYTLEHEFEDVIAVLEAIGQPTVLLGHSHGGICAMEAAALRPDLVRKLVLYEPPIRTTQPIYPAGLVDRLDSLLAQGDKAGVVTRFLTEVVRMPESEIKMLQTLPSWTDRMAAAHTIPRELRVLENYRLDRARFTEFTRPTLLLLGGASPELFKAATTAAHQALKNSRVVILPGQQHVAMNTAPDLFLNEVVAFIGP